jgi:hypothetical protein
MSEIKKRYVLEFLDTDSDQLYSDHLELTDAEAAELLRAVNALEDAGEITSTNGERWLEGYSVGLVEFREPEFVTLKELKRHWNPRLDDSLKDAGLKWKRLSKTA